MKSILQEINTKTNYNSQVIWSFYTFTDLDFKYINIQRQKRSDVCNWRENLNSIIYLVLVI